MHTIETFTGKLLSEIARDRGMNRPPRPVRRERKPFNGIRIPLNTQRDIILENDPIYCQSVRQLAAQNINGKARPHMEWLMASALRRAHVPFKLAQRMVRA